MERINTEIEIQTMMDCRIFHQFFRFLFDSSSFQSYLSKFHTSFISYSSRDSTDKVKFQIGHQAHRIFDKPYSVGGGLNPFVAQKLFNRLTLYEFNRFDQTFLSTF